MVCLLTQYLSQLKNSDLPTDNQYIRLYTLVIIIYNLCGLLPTNRCYRHFYIGVTNNCVL